MTSERKHNLFWDAVTAIVAAALVVAACALSSGCNTAAWAGPATEGGAYQPPGVTVPDRNFTASGFIGIQAAGNRTFVANTLPQGSWANDGAKLSLCTFTAQAAGGGGTCQFLIQRNGGTVCIVSIACNAAAGTGASQNCGGAVFDSTDTLQFVSAPGLVNNPTGNLVCWFLDD